jgi:hypothetical protein
LPYLVIVASSKSHPEEKRRKKEMEVGGQGHVEEQQNKSRVVKVDSVESWDFYVSQATNQGCPVSFPQTSQFLHYKLPLFLCLSCSSLPYRSGKQSLQFFFKPFYFFFFSPFFGELFRFGWYRIQLWLLNLLVRGMYGRLLCTSLLHGACLQWL